MANHTHSYFFFILHDDLRGSWSFYIYFSFVECDFVVMILYRNRSVGNEFTQRTPGMLLRPPLKDKYPFLDGSCGGGAEI
jgi:hypothetical protein